MSKYDKIKEKLLNPSVIMTLREVEYLLSKSGYIEKKTGKSAGSRKAYFNVKTRHIIRLHKPHPGNEIKKYVKQYLIAELEKQNLL